MNIIFGDDIKNLPDNYTILELDSFRLPGSDDIVKAYCVLENIPLGEFTTLDDYRNAHNELLKQYHAQNWEYCQSAIKALMGRWGGDLDSFYQNLSDRVETYVLNPPAEGWDGVILKIA
jgi:hypothetical protein